MIVNQADSFDGPISSKQFMSEAQRRIAASGAIDGGVELDRELARLAESSAIAADAPRGTGLTTYLSRGMAKEPLDGSPGEFTQLTEKLLQALTIWWSPNTFAKIPVMVPWCIRDRSARYDQGPESWSAPRADGYLRDDNSIIKKLPLPVLVSAPRAHSYAHRKPWRGFTACHIWRTLPGGAIAGTDPWLYSFMPNLVWMPSPLSALSDTHESHVQRLLQTTSLQIFRRISSPEPLRPYVEYAWSRLPAPPGGSRALDISELAYFAADTSFVERRVKYIDMFIAGADEYLEAGYLSRKLFSSRYTAGFQELAPNAVSKFRDELRAYRTAVTTAN